MFEVISLAKMTKAQQKRMVKDIVSKTQKLYMMTGNIVNSTGGNWLVSTQDMSAVQRLAEKWMRKIG